MFHNFYFSVITVGTNSIYSILAVIRIPGKDDQAIIKVIVNHDMIKVNFKPCGYFLYYISCIILFLINSFYKNTINTATNTRLRKYLSATREEGVWILSLMWVWPWNLKTVFQYRYDGSVLTGAWLVPPPPSCKKLQIEFTNKAVYRMSHREVRLGAWGQGPQH